MRIIYKNFIIEEDTYCFVLSEMAKKEKGDNVGEEYVKEQTYPATLKRAFELIVRAGKVSKKEVVDIKGYIEEIENINNKFLKEIGKYI